MEIQDETNENGTKIDWHVFQSVEARAYKEKLDAQKREDNGTNTNNENTEDDDEKSRTEEEEKMLKLEMKWDPLTSDDVS